MKAAVEPRLVTIDQAAQSLCVSPSTVKRLISDDDLKSVKIRGRRLIPTAELDRLVTEMVGRGDR